MKATKEQVQIAKAYHIPMSQAHTINISKVMAYAKFKSTPSEQINDFLDNYYDRESIQ